MAEKSETVVSFDKLVQGTDVPNGATIHDLEWVEGGLAVAWTNE